MRRDAKEVLAKVLGELTEKLDAPAESTSAKKTRRGNTVGPKRDRLTVGVIWETAGVSTAFSVWREKR